MLFKCFCLHVGLFLVLGVFVSSSAAPPNPAPGIRRALQDVSKCDCGFTDVDDPTSQLWTTYWESDFRQMSPQDVTASWRPMVYEVQRRMAAVRDFDPGNVLVDASGLHLTVKPPLDNGSVPSGGVFTVSKDFGFGSYHFEAQASPVVGTVQAFYIYRDDNNEVDIEYVSKNDSSPAVGFSVKPQIYEPYSGIASSETYQQAKPPFDLSAAFHNYSLVWNASRIGYAVDGNWSAEITTNVPLLPGALSIAHWSDGNPRYSGGPPMSPATITVSRAWVYYNATGASLPCRLSTTPCSGRVTAGAMESSASVRLNPLRTSLVAMLATVAFVCLDNCFRHISS